MRHHKYGLRATHCRMGLARRCEIEFYLRHGSNDRCDKDDYRRKVEYLELDHGSTICLESNDDRSIIDVIDLLGGDH